LELAEEVEELAGAGVREAAEALVPEQEEAGGGGDLLDDGVESFLLGGVGDLVEAVVEGDEAAPAGEAAVGEAVAAEVGAEGIAVGVVEGATDESGLGVEGGDRVVVGGDGFAGAVKSDEGAETGVLFEVGEGDVVDVDEGWGEGLAAEEAAEGAAGVGRRS